VDPKFCSVEQAFQYYRTLPHDDNVAEEILGEPNPYKAMQLAKKCPARKSEKTDIELMTKLVKAKVSQCRAFRDAMRSATAMGLRFVHSTYPSDKIFASGLRYDEKRIPTVLPGKNVLGAIVSDCARNLKTEEEYGVGDTRVEFVNGIAVVLHDGERLPLSLRRTPFPHTATTRKQKQMSMGRPLSPWERNPPPRDRHSYRNGHLPNHPSKGPVPICFHCGVPGHVIRDCRLKHVVVSCRACGQNGHKQKYCTSVSNGRQNAAPATTRATPPSHLMDPNNDKAHLPTPGLPVRTPYTARPNQSRGEDTNMCVPSAAQCDYASQACPQVYAPSFYPGTYGRSYYQNFPPLINSTQQNF
jgi:hypothetical protein